MQCFVLNQTWLSQNSGSGSSSYSRFQFEESTKSHFQNREQPEDPLPQFCQDVFEAEIQNSLRCFQFLNENMQNSIVYT